MNTEETGKKKDETNSTGCRFVPGKGMFEMMSACYAGKGGQPGCFAMMKGMTEKMGNQSCRAHGPRPESDGSRGEEHYEQKD